MGPAGRDVHDPHLPSADGIFDDLARRQATEADDRLSFENNELFNLGVVIMISPGDSRTGPGNEDLAVAAELEQLGQRPPFVFPDRQVVVKLLFGKVRDVRPEEPAVERIVQGRLGQGFPDGPERLDLPGQRPQRDAEDRRHGKKGRAAGAGAGLESGQKGGDDVVHMDKIDFPVRIGYRNRQIPGDIVAERGHDGVIIRPAPFAEDAGQAENPDGRPGSAVEIEESVFSPFLGAAVGIVQEGLDRGGKDDQRTAAAALEARKDRRQGADVSVLKFVFLFRPVDSGQVNDGFRFVKAALQDRGRRPEIDADDFGPGFAAQGQPEILSDESLGPGDKYPVHFDSVPSSSRTRASFIKRSAISSVSRRRVLWEL